MDCPNCGQYLSVESAKGYVKCEYCKCTVAPMRVASDFIPGASASGVAPEQADQVRSMLKLAESELHARNYRNAYETYEKILERNPLVWEAIVNEAICVFWLGREDLQHLNDVLRLLDRADQVSAGNQFVSQSRSEIAYNLAVLGSLRPRYGDDIQWSLTCFKYSKQLVPMDPQRDELIQEYTAKCGSESIDRLMRGLFRDKKQFEPTASELGVLQELVRITSGQQEQISKAYIAFAKQRISRRPDDVQVRKDLEDVTKLYAMKFPESREPIFVFPMFGSPRME